MKSMECPGCLGLGRVWHINDANPKGSEVECDVCAGAGRISMALHDARIAALNAGQPLPKAVAKESQDDA